MAERRPLAPLAILVLGLLVERPMHPYEMFQTTVERNEDRLVKFRPGTLYHTVDRLSVDGLIEVHEVRREGNRPERTVYTVTDTGRAALDRSLMQILESPAEEYPELYLALSEAHSLPRDTVADLLESRLHSMRTECETFEAAATSAAARGKPEMFYLDVGCRVATLRVQIEWLTDVVRRMRNHTIEWTDDPGSTYSCRQPADTSTAPEQSTAHDPSTAQKASTS